MTPLDQPGILRITVESRNPQDAAHTADAISQLTRGTGPEPPHDAGNGIHTVSFYAYIEPGPDYTGWD
ncbi:hypothetical protein [Streptomyces albus]|uniref:hypothetical protein n=1 Tax=Streptomyces albus TaxID=1888 RepID=UPI00340184FF